ncbi:asparagine synthase (glutamine-hydrolyzing) [Gilvimarinus algae]|uniref:asparagine synthase (glutamine-hydrolyzing) n=1 Tax=Gilvimarinus algae TaxID=3058037 RepID=A0ABT8TKE1_9GAMM|nr:asparagine synthase (glutamine-hydrolyzing) [Gilvimarinus sp. SDUM040014]MDO3382827.1 asparagine synthase (glutamine-hydrolyzing) [Gilvimarinus sp. SDUM040014]
MCGFIFQLSQRAKCADDFGRALERISWRGPDAQRIVRYNQGKVLLGHCRLAVVDLSDDANQPMESVCGRYAIVFNGEIYNHDFIRKKLNLKCKTKSDTETILEGYSLVGDDIFSLLDGMFSLVIYNRATGQWTAARDAFGIKPLFMWRKNQEIIFSSEASVVASLAGAIPCPIALAEWRVIRRPLPGASFFQGVEEVTPGQVVKSSGETFFHWKWAAANESFEQSAFEERVRRSVDLHGMSHVENVSLLSGGLDSAIVVSLAGTSAAYSVGLEYNNEFEGAQETADLVGASLKKVSVSEDELVSTWKYLTRLRGEPLSLPNEGLIYNVCRKMTPQQKVVLTGEGADEICFGYDQIFRWASGLNELDTHAFLDLYGYSADCRSERLESFVDLLKRGKSPIEFVEDFFLLVHLPCLLRRMDFASMAASKEARVPFVSKSLIGYCYRQPSSLKINSLESKLPIRKFAERLGLSGALQRKKIGFSAQFTSNASRKESYRSFQDIVLGELKW